MHIPRIYQAQSLSAQTHVVLDKQASHHLINVLRLQVGEPLIVFNGEGGEYQATLIAIDNKSAQVSLQRFVDIDRESPLSLHLGQVMARGEKMDWIMQKVVELGVSQITPLISDYCNMRLAQQHLAKKWQHWHKVIINACEQCARTRIPQLNPVSHLEQWSQQPFSGPSIVLQPQANQTIAELTIRPQSIRVAIGPEGGFSPHEIALLQQHDFQLCRFGPRILRSETAAIGIIACLQSYCGDC